MHGVLSALAPISEVVDGAEIDDILVRVPRDVVPIVLEPATEKKAPRTTYEAKFSLQYSTSAMLTHGRVSLTSYTPAALADDRVAALAQKVRYEIREYGTYPAAFPGGAVVRLTDGRELAREMHHQLGSPQNPMSTDAVLAKFRENASLSLQPSKVAGLESRILAIESLEEVGAVLG
jgi:2-methylcitrate dehydratase PrpD